MCSSDLDLWDNIKHTNICIIGVPEREEREKGTVNIFEDIIAENFCNLRKEKGIKSRRHRESKTRSNQTGSHQDTL